MKLDRSTLHGFVPAVVTPFAPDGALVERDFVALVDWLVGLGATAICVAGDNGESWNLDLAERARLTRLAAERVGRRMPVIAGVSAPSAEATIRYAKAVVDAGADGLLLLPQPYVLKASRDELLRRFERVARSVDAPMVLYNSPRRSGIDLTLDDIDAILGVAPVVGIKEASRDFFHHSHLIERFRSRMQIMVGPSHFLLPGLALGAHGFIASGPELLGVDAARLVALARAAPGDDYVRLHHRLVTVYELMMGTGTWPSALKAALNLQGQPAGVPREPVMALEGAALEKVRATLSRLGLLP